MEWHRNPPWMASTEDKLEEQASATSHQEQHRATRKKNKPERPNAKKN